MSLNKTQSSKVGRFGEDFTAGYLKEKGYIIIKRNWRDSRYGEIDIVAENREHIAFVEVKTRSENALFSGAEAIDYRKMQRLRNAAQTFMNRLNTDLDFKIDVAEVTVENTQDGLKVKKFNYLESVG